MLLAGLINKKPIDLANEIHKNLIEKNLDNIEEITVTTPGFINFVVKPTFYQNKIISIQLFTCSKRKKETITI